MKMFSYWDNHYQLGGVSGEGSIGEYREWKWKIITEYCPVISHVIDVGCGDNSFWQGRECLDYLGIDSSNTIIIKNRQKRPEWKFINAPAELTQQISAPVVFCMDMLFHILNDDIYEKIIKNIAFYTQNYLFIYTWQNNPFIQPEIKKYVINEYFLKRGHLLMYFLSFIKDIESDGIYQKYRDFSRYEYLFNEAGLTLIEVKKYPGDDFGAMYIFKKSP